MPEAVSDSSTLIHLASISLLGLLNEFFEHVLIPPAVWQEVVVQGAGRKGASDVRQANSDEWLIVETPAPNPILHFLRAKLDDGEAESIALALERLPEVLLLDEEHARAIARQLGVRITGAVGILLRAKLAGLIPLLRPELDQLRGSGHCYLSQAIYESVLRQSGE